MEIITGNTQFNLEKNTAVAIGKFDGIHIGHRRLLKEILLRRECGLAACVFTFDPSPTVFFGGQDEKELTTREEKRSLFEKLGVDILVEYPLNRESAAVPPEIFAEEILAKRMKARFLAAGIDLSFGAGGAGNAALLQKLGPGLGFEVKTIDKVCLDGREVSSTLVRARVEQGDMEAVSRLLGMPYRIAGKVVHGKQLGRTMGFPTVNLLPPKSKLLPPKGVYFSQVHVGERTYRAISNVGYKPTVTDERVMGVESFLYDFEESIYGEYIEVSLNAFHRPEQRFESVEALRMQIREDIAAGRNREKTG